MSLFIFKKYRKSTTQSVDAKLEALPALLLDINSTGGSNLSHFGYATGVQSSTSTTIKQIAFFATTGVSAAWGTGSTVRLGVSSLITTGSGHTLSTVPWLTQADASPAYIDIPVASIVSGQNKLSLSSTVTIPSSTSFSIVIQDPTGSGALYTDHNSTISYTAPFSSTNNRVGTSSGSSYVNVVNFDVRFQLWG